MTYYFQRPKSFFGRPKYPKSCLEEGFWNCSFEDLSVVLTPNFVCRLEIFVCDRFFFVEFAMLPANFVRSLFPRSLNLLCFLTTLYHMRSSNVQNAHEGSTKVLQGFHEIVALKNYVNQVFHRNNEIFALFFRYSNSIPVLYFST